MYQRVEDDSARTFYELYAEWMEAPPLEVQRFVAKVQVQTGLARQLDEYPVELGVIRAAADAAESAARECFAFDLRMSDSDDTQLDRLINGHFVSPALRVYLQTGGQGLSAEAMEQYAAARNALQVPREPLLYYALGAFWGEWQVRHRQACWSLFAPLRPVQSFPDMITVGPTICSHPFSQVCKKMTDPEGDNLAFKTEVAAGHKRYLPPFPLLASLDDANEAMKQLLPEPAQRGVDAESAGDAQRAYELYCEAAYYDGDHPQLLSRIIAVAWQLQKYDMVDGVFRRLLELVPDHPVTCHNLAALYAGYAEYRDQAIALLQRALRADPNYARARITLASCYREQGNLGAAREQAQWVIENDQQLRDEAMRFLQELDA